MGVFIIRKEIVGCAALFEVYGGINVFNYVLSDIYRTSDVKRNNK